MRNRRRTPYGALPRRLAALLLFGTACHTAAPPSPAFSVVAQARSDGEQFDALWEKFASVYPSFAYKGVDWRAQRTAYRGRAVRARSQDEFIAIAREMLEPLHDLHVWFIDPRGAVVPTYRPATVANFDRNRWERALRDAGMVTKIGGMVEANVGGYPYLFISSWKTPADAATLDAALARAHDAPGLIIDVRTNSGGSDATALAILARFTPTPLVASYVQVRNGPAATDLDMPSPRIVQPHGAWQFTRPVVVIAGRAGFSATESFVAAMRTLPNVMVIGDTTGGASGNPVTFALNNGWQVTVPRWLEFGPDRVPIEGRGVAPNLPIPWLPSQYDSERDPLIDAAVGVLGERNGLYRVAPVIDGAAPRQSGASTTGPSGGSAGASSSGASGGTAPPGHHQQR